VGKGKAEQAGARARELGANLLIFDDQLSPAQARNIEKLSGLSAIDRTELILDIFALHARSLEARTQVELAQLRYMLPRLRRMWEHLSRLGGGIGTRGPGETQLEVDRRKVRERISHLRKELGKISKERQVQKRRRARESVFRTALVGYTNVGKTSLLNALTNADAVVRNQLFTTLDSLTRALVFPSGQRVVLTDTVGLIRKLPHELVASFRSTLEEAVEADFLLLVANAADPHLEERLGAAHEVLDQIGALGRPTCLVLNQIDRLEEDERTRMAERHPDAVLVSALTGDGLEALKERIREEASRNDREVTARLPVGETELIQELRVSGRLLEASYRDGAVMAKVRLSPPLYERFERAGYLVG
jgi:GTP-binding protein HflX